MTILWMLVHFVYSQLNGLFCCFCRDKWLGACYNFFMFLLLDASCSHDTWAFIYIPGPRIRESWGALAASVILKL